MTEWKDTDVSNLLGSLSDNLQLVIDQLKDGENKRGNDPNFDSVGFWTRFGLTFKAVSTEATKLTMAFASHPHPDAKGAETLIGGLQKSTLALLSAFYSLPITQGRTLHGTIFNTVLSILVAAQSLVQVIKNEGVEGSKRQLQATGGVWEYCDSFATLPKNNKDAVVDRAREYSDLVKDALEEIESAIDDDEDDEPGPGQTDDDRWSDRDRELLAPALGLIKAARSSNKKAVLALKDNGKSSDEANINQLDEILDVTSRVSPAVDDFVLSLYPPLNPENVNEEAQNLSDVLLCLLAQVRSSHITSKADVKWIDFLTKAVKHNHEKLKQLLPV